jgi:hypothetical protein
LNSQCRNPTAVQQQHCDLLELYRSTCRSAHVQQEQQQERTNETRVPRSALGAAAALQQSAATPSGRPRAAAVPRDGPEAGTSHTASTRQAGPESSRSSSSPSGGARPVLDTPRSPVMDMLMGVKHAMDLHRLPLFGLMRAMHKRPTGPGGGAAPPARESTARSLAGSSQRVRGAVGAGGHGDARHASRPDRPPAHLDSNWRLSFVQVSCKVPGLGQCLLLPCLLTLSCGTLD